MSKIRLAIDLGAASIGWAILSLNKAGDPDGILAAGSRIFSNSANGAGRDAKTGASLGVDRRDARAMRRRRDRFKQRQAALIKYLTLDGFFPADEAERKKLEALDPYELRARALLEKLTPDEIGRAFFHLNQRRGFQSNRKADRGKNDSENGKIAIGTDRLREAMIADGSDTLGQFLHRRRARSADKNAIAAVRVRMRPETGEDAKGDGYDFYPARDLLKDEFERIWEKQSSHHSGLMTQAVHDRLFEIVFHQRPLKQPKIGKCTLVPEEERLPKAHPLFQLRRLYEEINALRIARPGEIALPLNLEQRDALFLKLKDKKEVSFESLRKVLKLEPEARFNKESENRPKLAGDEVAAVMGDKKRFGTRWPHLALEKQWEIIQKLGAVESAGDEANFRAWLAGDFGLSTEEANAVLGAHLPEGYGRFGLTATTRLLVALKNEVIVYSEAVQKAGLGHHSDMRTGEIFANLPYYGEPLERFLLPGTGDPAHPVELRIGRLTNPTVHNGLNQLRRIVNALIRRFGKPAEIAIELARELKLDEDEKTRRNRENNENRVAAERRGKKLEEIGIPNTGGNRAILRLWEELDGDNAIKFCVYSGKPISLKMLFDGRAEVDHILPFTRTFDDSNANKIVCLREKNREKRGRAPHEAWGHDDNWAEIAARASRLPKNKRWRFEPDAMEKNKEQGGFEARMLTDTQYLARLAHTYLAALYPEKGEGSGHIWVSPGRMTEMVRRKLGLNDLLPDHNYAGGADQPKNRLDHRHHAIDAAVIGVVDRRLLQEIARASGREGADGRERVMIPEPWPGFRDDLKKCVDRISVSHRADHGTVRSSSGGGSTAGKLHNDTAYGLTGEKDAKGNDLVVSRVSLESIKKFENLDGVRDPVLRAEMQNFLRGCEGKAFEVRIREFSSLGPLPYRNIRRVRMIQPLNVIPIHDKSGAAYKGYKGDSNFRYDVWELKDGKWVAEVVSMFDAHQAGWQSQVRQDQPTARKVLSLKQNDTVAIEEESETVRLMRVVKFSQNGSITLAAINESGDLKKRDAQNNELDPFKYKYKSAGSLKSANARQVRIDPLGHVYDPGFPARKAIRRTVKQSG